MKTPARILTVALLLGLLLTWLMLHSFGPDEAVSASIQQNLYIMTLNEAALHRDVLRARDGLLRNYDPIVSEIEAVRRVLRVLQADLAVRPAATPLVDRLAAAWAQQEALVELFKTNNAQLQNSLAYFDLLSAEIGTGDMDPRLAMAVGELASSVLHMTRETTPEVVATARRRLSVLQDLAAVFESPDTKESLATLIRHGELLTRLLPAMDVGVAAFFALSTRAAREAIKTEVEDWRRHDMDVAEQFQLALYVVAILLLTVLVRGGLQLRNGALALRRRSSLEHLIARVSTSFIGCPPDAVNERLQDALTILGPGFGADRAYLLLANPAPNVLLWQAPNTVASPPGWPESALHLETIAAAPDELTYLYITRSLPPGRMRDVLVAARVTGWAAVELRHDGRRLGLLGFDNTTSAIGWPFGGLGLVRMAGEVVSHAMQSRVAAQERTELQTRLLRARRLETVGTFASGIAHNFNNIIGAVIGHAEMVADRLHAGTPAADHVQEIQLAGERARELVGHILDFGTRNSAKRKALSADALLTETLSMFRASLPPNVVLHTGKRISNGYVNGDPIQLQQVLANLIRNAGQAIEPPGEITVSADRQEIAVPRSLSHAILPVGAYVRFQVTDTGIGMAPAVLKQIFNPFFTTRPAGTGLGLATVHEIVQDHDGGMHVWSALHEGSGFEVWLPAVSPTTASDGISWRGQGETVLVLGGSKAVVLHNEEMLAALGFEPVGFTTPDAALAACRCSSDRFDVMLVEWQTSEDDGSDTVSALRVACPKCPIVLVTNATEDSWAAGAATVEFIRVLNRPLRSVVLAAAMAECLQPRREAG